MSKLKDMFEPDPAEVHSQIFLPSAALPATIPAFPSSPTSPVALFDLPEDLYHGVKSACGSHSYSGQAHQTRLLPPVLAAWLYSAYSRTALHRAVTKLPQSTSVDMPVLPTIRDVWTLLKRRWETEALNW
ncbi:hypothetical protein HAX54_013402 [Datura stramonium]|uniref:Uncharacterized protein n=1 Tax=Datura stramonium TaxID=4076 RepID=A0ABS8RYS9_DATST|nr:hypothetical protein [Datura stramonium]